MTTSRTDLLRLKVKAGEATPEEIVEYEALVKPKQQPELADEEWESAEVDMVAFQKGWQSNTPPTKAGMYKGYLIEIAKGTEKTENVFLTCINQPGEEEFHGAMVCALNKASAGKFGDILRRLHISYRENGNVLQWKRLGEKIPVKVKWDYVLNKNRNELRIQDILGPEEKVEQPF